MSSEADDLTRLAAIRPDDPADWVKKAEHSAKAGADMSRAGDPSHGSELLESAAVINRVLAQRFPTQAHVLALAVVESQVAIVAMSAGRNAAAERAFRNAMAAYERLVVEFMDSAQLMQWGRVAVGLATLLKSLAREQECEQVLASASSRMRDAGQCSYTEWQAFARKMLATIDAPSP